MEQNGKRYTKEEVNYIVEHYEKDGPVAVSHFLGRDSANIAAKARSLGLIYKKRKDILSEEKKRSADLRYKADTSCNENAEELEEIMRTRKVLDDGKIAVRIDSRTIILMKPSKATPEHISKLRNEIGKAQRA